MGFRAEWAPDDAGNFLTPCPSWGPRKWKPSPVMVAHGQGPCHPLHCILTLSPFFQAGASVFSVTMRCKSCLLCWPPSPYLPLLRLHARQHQAPVMSCTGCAVPSLYLRSCCFLCLGRRSPSVSLQQASTFAGRLSSG